MTVRPSAMPRVVWAGLTLLLSLFNLAASGFQPRTVRSDGVVPLLDQGPPHPVAAFHPAGVDLRLESFDTAKALFVASAGTSEDSVSYFVEAEPLGLHPPLDLPLDEDLTIQVAGEFEASYVLYLPPGYSVDNPPPLIFAFPPFGQGQRLIQPLKASARRLGWVLIGCNGSSNGRNEIFFPTAREIILDVRRRVVHDRRREVLLGFSGGAMGSYRLSRTFWDEFAGLVALGGWLGVYEEHSVYPPRLAVARINGKRDDGARENERRDRAVLDRFGLASKIFRFPGGHTLPPTQTLDEALDWLTERWRGLEAPAGSPGLLLQTAVTAAAQGRASEAAERALDLILNHAFSWQAQAAEDLLAATLGNPAQNADVRLSPRREFTPRILYGKARGVSALPARTVAYLEAGLRLDPRDTLIQSRLAFELFQLDAHSQRARALAEQALAENPDYWLVHYVKGLLAEADGNRQAAIDHVRRALKLAPNALQMLCSQTLESWGAQ